MLQSVRSLLFVLIPNQIWEQCRGGLKPDRHHHNFWYLFSKLIDCPKEMTNRGIGCLFCHSFNIFVKLLWISALFVWGSSSPDTGWTAVRGADASVISLDGSLCSPPRLQRAAELAASNKVKQKKSEHASRGKEKHGVIRYCSSFVSPNGTDSLFPVSSWECGRWSAGEEVLRGHFDAEQWVNIVLGKSSFRFCVVAAEVNGP